MPARTHDPATGPGATAKPSRLATLFADYDANPRYAWTTRRRNRLLLVVTQAALLAAALAMSSLERPGWALVLFLPFFPLMGLINIGIHGLLDIPAAHLDETMVRIRTEAKARAHTILVVLVGLVLLVAPFGTRSIGEQFSNDPRGVTLFASSIAFGLFFFVMLLPTWILAWRLPDQQDAAADTIPAHPQAHDAEPNQARADGPGRLDQP